MKILVLTHEYPSEGSHSSAFVQARVDLYRRMRHDVTIVTQRFRVNNAYIANHPEETFVGARFQQAADNVFVHPEIVEPETLERKPLTETELLSMRPEIIAAHTPLPGIVTQYGRRFGSVPVICFVHGYEGIHAPKDIVSMKLKGRVFRMISKPKTWKFLIGSDAVVVASRWMEEQVRAYFGLTKWFHVDVIPNPVDPILFPLLSERHSNKGLCLRGENRKYGVDLLRMALKHMNGAEHLDVDIVDPGFDRKDLQWLLVEYGFFVAPARAEGQGVMMCEAAATGMPVLATNVAAIPEFIDPRFHNLVQPTPDYLSIGLREMRSYLPDTLDERKAIRNDMLERCGPDASVEEDLGLFEDVLNGATQRGMWQRSQR